VLLSFVAFAKHTLKRAKKTVCPFLLLPILSQLEKKSKVALFELIKIL